MITYSAYRILVRTWNSNQWTLICFPQPGAIGNRSRGWLVADLTFDQSRLLPLLELNACFVQQWILFTLERNPSSPHMCWGRFMQLMHVYVFLCTWDWQRQDFSCVKNCAYPASLCLGVCLAKYVSPQWYINERSMCNVGSTPSAKYCHWPSTENQPSPQVVNWDFLPYMYSQQYIIFLVLFLRQKCSLSHRIVTDSLSRLFRITLFFTADSTDFPK